MSPSQRSRNLYLYEPDFIDATRMRSIRWFFGTLGGAFLYLAIIHKPDHSSMKSKTAFGILGIGLLIRAISNHSLTRLFALATSPVIEMHRTIDVDVPVEEAFSFWENFSNFPKFMSYVREVSINDRGGLHWKLEGPGGMHSEWNASLGSLIPNQRLQWKTEPGSMITNSGDIRFRSLTPERAQIQVTLCYAPPAGALGALGAKIFGFDPRDRIDHDLEVMRDLIEKNYRFEKVRQRTSP